MSKVSTTTAVILGGLGSVGRLFNSLLTAAGIHVTTVDQRSAVAAGPETYVQADLGRASNDVLGVLCRADIVIVALPETTALQAANWILEGMRADALWVDTLSVKTEICRLLSSLDSPRERLSLNPMFAPSLGFRGQVVAAIEVASGPMTERVESLIVTCGGALERTSPEAHDQITSATQVATHAAILAFGLTIRELGYNSQSVWKLSTPPHRILLALLNRLVNGNPQVYWDIQRHHVNSPLVRTQLHAAVASINDMIERDAYAEFRKAIDEVKDLLVSVRPDLLNLGEKLLQGISESGDKRLGP